MREKVARRLSRGLKPSLILRPLCRDFSRLLSSFRSEWRYSSAVGLTELVHGIYRADTTERRLRRQQFVEELRAGLTVYPYTDQTAWLAGRIDGEQTAKGVMIPFPDLLIGATAFSLGELVDQFFKTVQISGREKCACEPCTLLL